jgi:hypothetical protein
MRNHISFFTLVITLLFLTACNTVDLDSDFDLDESFFENANTIETKTVALDAVTVVQSGSGSYRFSETEQMVINNHEEFEAIWEELYSTLSPTPELPEIDFDEYTVIAVMMGAQPTGGYSIQIEKVSEADGVIGVKISENEPGTSCSTIQVVTSPFHIVKIPNRDSGDFKFSTSRTTTDCSS